MNCRTETQSGSERQKVLRGKYEFVESHEDPRSRETRPIEEEKETFSHDVMMIRIAKYSLEICFRIVLPLNWHVRYILHNFANGSVRLLFQT